MYKNTVMKGETFVEMHTFNYTVITILNVFFFNCH